jgi:tetratricopeptide (TPR) repeat protein
MVAALALLGAVAALPAEEGSFPRGQIIDRVVCRDNPAKSYGLYLPSAYNSGRAWPILYVFDSRGIRSDEPLISRFVAGAERFGWIVASSNDSANAVSMDENIRSLGAMWADTHARFSVDDRRAYGFGFSGMARMITMSALRSPDTLQGVIVAGSGFPVGVRPSPDLRFPYYAISGETDFSYYELLDLEGQLAAADFTHRVEIFDGSHQWPPEQVASQAMAWLELLAMKTGARTKDRELVATLWSEDLARAQALEKAGKSWRAWRVYRAMARDFADLADVARAQERAGRIEQDPSFQRQSKARRARDRRDREFLLRAPRIFSAAGPEIRPDTKSQLLADLKIPDWKKRAKSDDPDERLAAERVLYALYIQLAYYLPLDLIESKQWDRAILYLDVAAEIDPDSPRIPYRRATAYAGKGNKKQALAELEKALKLGGTDRAEIAADPAFAGLVDDLSKP